MSYSDPSGLCPWCVVGGVVGGGFKAWSQYQSDGPFDWGSFAASTATGAFGGLESGVGNTTSGIISKMNQSYFNSLPLAQQLLLGSNAMHGLHNSHLITGGVTIGNTVGGVVSNLPVNVSSNGS